MNKLVILLFVVAGSVSVCDSYDEMNDAKMKCFSTKGGKCPKMEAEAAYALSLTFRTLPEKSNWDSLFLMCEALLSKFNLETTARNTAEMIVKQAGPSAENVPAKELISLLMSWLDSLDVDTVDAVTKAIEATIKHLPNDEADELIKDSLMPKFRDIIMTTKSIYKAFSVENSLKMVKMYMEKDCNYVKSIVDEQFVEKLNEIKNMRKNIHTKTLIQASTELADAILKCNDPQLQPYHDLLDDTVNNAARLKLASKGLASTAESLKSNNKNKHNCKMSLCGLFGKIKVNE